MRKPEQPSKAPPYVMGCFKALESGTASDDQQKLALKYLLTEICRAYDLSYIPGDTHATAFAEGKRAVGLEIITMLNVDQRKLGGNYEPKS